MSPSSLRAAPLLALIASAAFACSGAGVDSDADTDTAAASEASGGATSGSSGGGSTGGATATGTDSAGSDGDSDGDSDSGEPAGPHALGTIVLGESHPAAGGSTTRSPSRQRLAEASRMRRVDCVSKWLNVLRSCLQQVNFDERVPPRGWIGRASRLHGIWVANH